VAVLLADRTLTVSSSLRDQLLHTERTWLAPLLEGRVQPVVTGFDFARVDAALREPRDQARAATGPAPDRLSALMVGGIYHDKGQLPFVERVLPRLVAEVPSIHVTFIGGVKDPAYVSRLKDVLRRTGTESHTSFPGYLPIADVYRWYRGADLLLLPSEREGLPRAAIEAQAFALPVVATRIVGSLEVVADGQTGFLIDPDRLEDMIPAIRRLSDPALRQNMGAAGSRLVRDRYSLERNVREIGDIYRELLSGS
jgi:glycosyltransferase involved in cell wall biosynthesis